MAAYSVGEAFCGWFTELEHLWAGLAAQVGSAFGAGDEQQVMVLMRMGLITAAVCGIFAWSIVFPFGKFLLEAAFVMHQDVHDYAVPFVYAHMLGNFSMCEERSGSHAQRLSYVYVLTNSGPTTHLSALIPHNACVSSLCAFRSSQRDGVHDTGHAAHQSIQHHLLAARRVHGSCELLRDPVL
jgi:hypothetical protein